MSQWLLVIILAGCGAGFLTIPFFRTRAPVSTKVTSPDAEGRLRKTDDKEAHGRAAAAMAIEERREIERRVSAASVPNPARQPRSPGADRVTAALIAAVVVVGAIGVYIAAEQPGATFQTGEPVSQAAAAQQQQKLPDVDTMIARVADRLKNAPGNAEDWRMLGWSYFETQRYPQAVDAYSHAVALQPDSAAFQSAYGEALVLSSGGSVTAKALGAFKVALKGTPNDERALHYVGLAKRQQGDMKGAVADWLLALKNAKPDSLWAPRLRAEIDEIAKVASIDVSAQLSPPGPVSDEKFAAPASLAVQQAQSMTPEEQQSMIRSMVAGLDERLARNPRDREGWVRLIRSRKVLGEPDLARSALDRALAAFRDDPATRGDLKAAAIQLGVSPAGG